MPLRSCGPDPNRFRLHLRQRERHDFLGAMSRHSGALFELNPSDMTRSCLLQVDRLVGLLETPAFTFLRLHLLQPGRHPALLQ